MTKFAGMDEGGTSSSDGQFFKAGGHGDARADYNAKYGSEPGVKFLYACLRCLGVVPHQGRHILDGLLHRECSLAIREHHTDTVGVVDHVFGL